MTPYEILGIGPTASQDEADEAYHRLLRVHHPDLHQHDSPEAIAAAEQRTQACNLAIAQIRGGWRPQPAGPGPGFTSSDGATGYGEGRRYAYAPGPDYRRGAEARTGGPAADAPGRGPHSAAGGAGGTGGDEPGTAWVYDEPVLSTVCALCGQHFGHVDEFAEHAWVAHRLRLDQRTRRRRRRIVPRVRVDLGIPKLSMWALVPLNAGIALVAASVSMKAGATDVAYWVFALAMAPTFVRILSGADEL